MSRQRWIVAWACVALVLVAAAGLLLRDQTVPTSEPPATSETWPSARTTGVPLDVILTESGPLVITQPGSIIDGLLVRGSITVQAPDVVIRRTKVVGGVIRTGDDASTPLRTVISDVEIDGRGLPDAARQAGIGFGGFTVTRADIHHVGIGVNASFDAVVRDSYIHDLVVAGDPGSGGTHNDGILSNGGQGMRFVGNHIDVGTQPNVSGAICLYGDFAPIRDVLIERNVLSGGGYALYAGSIADKPFPRARSVRVLGNRFRRGESGLSGTYGPVFGWSPSGGNTWRDNTWEDTGEPVTP